jgi:hypothetical protein
VRNRSIQQTYKKIAQTTGLNERWIEKFAQQKCGDAGVKKVQTLHDYLIKSAQDLEPVKSVGGNHA